MSNVFEINVDWDNKVGFVAPIVKHVMKMELKMGCTKEERNWLNEQLHRCAESMEKIDFSSEAFDILLKYSVKNECSADVVPKMLAAHLGKFRAVFMEQVRLMGASGFGVSPGEMIPDWRVVAPLTQTLVVIQSEAASTGLEQMDAFFSQSDKDYVLKHGGGDYKKKLGLRQIRSMNEIPLEMALIEELEKNSRDVCNALKDPHLFRLFMLILLTSGPSMQSLHRQYLSHWSLKEANGEIPPFQQCVMHHFMRAKMTWSAIQESMSKLYKGK